MGDVKPWLNQGLRQKKYSVVRVTLHVLAMCIAITIMCHRHALALNFTTPIPTCRSAQNSAEIDAQIAEFESGIKSLENLVKNANGALSSDYENEDALRKAFGDDDPRAVRAMGAAFDDRQRLGSLNSDLNRAKTHLAALRAVQPCPKENQAAKPGVPGGGGKTPVPTCRSAQNAAEIDGKIADLEKEVASLTNNLAIAKTAVAADQKSLQVLSDSLGPADPKTKSAAAASLQSGAREKALAESLARVRGDLAALKALPRCPEDKAAVPQPPLGPGATPQPPGAGATLQPPLPAPGAGAPPVSPTPTPMPTGPGASPPNAPAPIPGPGALPKPLPTPPSPASPDAGERTEIGKAILPSPPGLYVGFTAGGASGSSRWREPNPAASTDSFGLGGGLAGGTVGYAAQDGLVMFGLEADIAGGSISGSTSVNCFTPCRTGNSFLATVRGRAGIDLGSITPFVTGGLAVGEVNANVAGFPGAGTTRAGWAAGGGLQLPLTALARDLPEGLVVKAEWLHIDLGSPHVCTPSTCGGNADVKFQAEVFRVGLNVPLTALMPR